MRNIINTIVVISLMIMPTFAQSEHSVMSLVRKNYSGAGAVNSSFDLTIYWDVREREEKKSGEFIVAPGNRFRVTLGKESFVSDGTTYWQYNERNSQVVIRSAEDIDAATLPTSILSTFLTNRTFSEQKRVGNAIELIWDGGGKDVIGDGYTKIVALVEEKSGIIKVLALVDKSDNVHTYTFKKTTFDKTPKKESFTFTPPRGVEVVDMREK